MSKSIPFEIINWSTIPNEEHSGQIGKAIWKNRHYDGLRVRIVEYSRGYLADHWCKKGHVVHCLQGSFVIEMFDGTKHQIMQDESYIVSDDMSTHRSFTEEGVKLFIVDGDFLQPATPRPATNLNDLPAE